MSQLMKGICIAISIKAGGIMKLTSELVNRQKTCTNVFARPIGVARG